MALPLSTDQIDVALDPVTGGLPPTGDLTMTTGIAAIVQGVKIRLRLIAGEWFLNTAQGVRYFARLDGSVTQDQAIFGSKFDENKIIREFRDNLLGNSVRNIVGVPGLIALPVLKVSFDNVARALTVVWRASTAFGDTNLNTLAIPIAGQAQP